VRKTIVFKSTFSHIESEQPTIFWNFLALHSSQTEKITLKDFVILAERSPLSSPISNWLLQFVYGFSDRSLILLVSIFLRCRYFLAWSKNSGVKYVL
jgi:hypothetical protein